MIVAQAVGHLPSQGDNQAIKPFLGVSMNTADQQRDFETGMKATLASIALLAVAVLASIIDFSSQCNTCSAAGQQAGKQNPCVPAIGKTEPERECTKQEANVAGACAACSTFNLVVALLPTVLIAVGLFLCTKMGPRDRNVQCLNLGLCGHGSCFFCSCCCGVVLAAFAAVRNATYATSTLHRRLLFAQLFACGLLFPL